MKTTVWMAVSVAVATMLTTGCKNKDQDQMAALGQQHRVLTERINRAYADLQTCVNERDALNQQLASAQNERDSLRAQLASMPEPETAPPGWTSVPGGGMIAIDDSVLFAPGKVTLRDEAIRTLGSIASTLQGEYGDKDIIIFGHTDDRPIRKSGWKDNWQLSSERALAVVRFLQEQGVRANRLVSAGCGEYRPRVPNNSEPNRTRNRRVEIFAIDPQALTGRSG